MRFGSSRREPDSVPEPFWGEIWSAFLGCEQSDVPDAERLVFLPRDNGESDCVTSAELAHHLRSVLWLLWQWKSC
jgi:hypothetical protein